VPSESAFHFEVLPKIFAFGLKNIYYVAEIGNNIWSENEIRIINAVDKVSFEFLGKDCS